MKALKDFLSKNPVRMEKYVSGGFAVLHGVMYPVRKFMEHLLTVQGIDLKTQPGERARKALIDALNRVDDSKDYSEDYDFNWAYNKYKKLREKHPNMTKEAYTRLTDLGQLSDHPDNPLSVAVQRNIQRDQIKDITKQYLNDMENKSSFKEESAVDVDGVIRDLDKFSDEFKAGNLKEALKTITKYAKTYENSMEIIDSSHAEPTVNTKNVKIPTKSTKTLSPIFRRAEIGDKGKNK